MPQNQPQPPPPQPPPPAPPTQQTINIAPTTLSKPVNGGSGFLRFAAGIALLVIASVVAIGGYQYLTKPDKTPPRPESAAIDGSKGHATEPETHFGDARDDQSYQHVLTDDEVNNCRVSLADGKQTMPVEAWFHESDKDPSFGDKHAIDTKYGRPVIQIKARGEKVGPFYIARWTEDWHVDCAHVNDR